MTIGRLAEPITLLAATPLLLFPRGYLAWLGLALLAFAWVAGALSTRVLVGHPYLKHAALILVLMSFVGLYVSVDRGLSLPKFYGILLGLGVFVAAIRTVRTPRGVVQAAYLISALAALVAVIGAVGAEWNTGKLPLLQPWRDLFPRFITNIPTSFGARAGIHPNELGGTLAFLLPVPLALLASAGGLRRKLPCFGILVLGVAFLALSGSRSGLIAFAVAVLLLAVWYRPGLRFVVLGAVVIAALGLYLSRDDMLLTISGFVSSDSSAPSRIDLWTRTVELIQDFPFTGVGLNTFPLVLDSLYPSFAGVGESFTPSAHNVFLQTAADLGLAGLVALLGISGFVAKQYGNTIGDRLAQSTPKTGQAAVVGMIVGVLTYLVFGLTDAITLGAKPAVLVWLMLGLVIASRNFTSPHMSNGARPRPADGLLGRAELRIVVDLYWTVGYVLVFLAFVVAFLAAIL